MLARFLAFDPYVVARARLRNLEWKWSRSKNSCGASDYVLVNCPLTPQTRGLLGKPQFALMKPDAVLINTARGPIVDEAALIEALENGRIGGAALDVFEKEPLSANSPLAAMENVILTSHSIAWTEELFRDMGRIDCQGALAIYRGEAPEHVVNPQVLSSPAFLQKLAKYKAAFSAAESVAHELSPAAPPGRPAFGPDGA